MVSSDSKDKKSEKVKGFSISMKPATIEALDAELGGRGQRSSAIQALAERLIDDIQTDPRGGVLAYYVRTGKFHIVYDDKK